MEKKLLFNAKMQIYHWCYFKNLIQMGMAMSSCHFCHFMMIIYCKFDPVVIITNILQSLSVIKNQIKNGL